MRRAIAVLDATAGFVCSVGDKLNVHQEFRLGIDAPPLSDGAVKQAMTTRSAIAAGDQLIAPMIAGDQIIGVLGVGGKEERGAAKRGTWAEDDLRFLESLASIGAAAIDNARNFHRLSVLRESLEDENRNLKQRMLREYSDRLMVGDSLKMQRVADLVARGADS